MPTFHYRARNSKGNIVSGEIEADSQEACIAKLRERNFYVSSIKEVKKRGGNIVLFGGGVSAKEVSIFARQFATMIGSGVPIVRCLTILQAQADNPAFRNIISQVRVDVESGTTLSKALEKYPKTFSNLFCSLVKAGEVGGILDVIMERLADYLESSEDLKSKVKGAMTYPVVVSLFAVVIVIALVVFVLPQFKEIFAGMDVELPLPTKLLLGLSDLMIAWWFLFLIGGFAIVVGLIFFFSSAFGKHLWDTYTLKIPKIGLMLRKVAIAKFTRTLGTLVSSGVPILQALEVTSQSSGNVVISDAIDKTRVSIREGESIADPLKNSGVFPPMVVQMIAVGEETGELDKMLTKIADFYDSEVDAAVKGITSVIEPIMIIGMGIVIGGIVLAVFMPMMQMVNM